MTASIEFFPVGNGDMTLIRLASGKTILVDINIRKKADSDNEPDYPDVASMLKDRLERDPDNGNLPYVDVFMLSHPDQDHCGGLREHFHLGAPSQWGSPEDGKPEKILIREMWSAPLTFRRKDKVDGGLTADAEAWRDEAKRRVKLKKGGEEKASLYGNLIRVLGEDVHDKTEGIEDVVVNVGDTLSEICGEADSSFTALLLSPKIVSEEEAEELAGKNNSSIVMQFSLAAGEKAVDEQVAARFLTGGDAEVDIWKRVWGRNEGNPENFSYHVLQTPHHCSLGVLSHDQYSDRDGKKGKGEECEIDDEAYSALSQAESGTFIVSSCEKPEANTGKDLAWRKYEEIAADHEGKKLCTMVDSPDKPLKITITDNGPSTTENKSIVGAIPPKVEKGTSEKPYA